MPRQRRKLSESGIHHVMMRGVNRCAIFLEEADYRRFLEVLSVAVRLSGCHVLAYCLMPNHVHLVLRTGEEQIGQVIKRVGVRYVGWFNLKYSRVGHLFQDRFRSEPVDSDAYLLVLLRYVWNNPVEAGIVGRAEDYPWSSRRHWELVRCVVDHAELERLIPADELNELGAEPSLSLGPRHRSGRRPRIADDDAQLLLVRVCGAADMHEFARLAAPAQRRAIRELFDRSVSYRQLAHLTGLSVTQVRRMQIAGQD
ncbi:REP element-mobilizing transposase RayT [Propionicimonas paludicola]|uniref:REP element-mobilizing transposase RayT n=1 Tax=Propionicimonas paludicola TaxID=185243 RepID=A0A2A9CU42_9ACTN|nr:transposase [Propionicimonas paludicola]PFG17977.1 REP element-mobilizing transposase RayT [Propionicimonas paludicola]